MTITFVLPGNNRSGGVRVTVAMGNALRQLGHIVRLVYPRPRRMTRAWVKALLGRITDSRAEKNNAGWMHEFTGQVETFLELDDLEFAEGEVVIAVGSLTIGRVYHLQRNVRKVRYNHGLLLNMSDHEKAMWALPLPTITVSRTIIPDLERLTGKPVLAVVPNGIDLEEYRLMPSVVRDGIGTIYGEHPAKAPQDTLAMLARTREMFPQLPQYVFGTATQPTTLKAELYHRLPSVAEARAIYNRALYWLVTSRTEGFSLPILEAMACGCAVISTDTHGGRELIRDGENGLLVQCGDVAGAVVAIQRLMADEAFRLRLVEQGLATAATFSWPHAAAKMEGFLNSMICQESENRNGQGRTR